MINGVNPNGDIMQTEAKKSVGINPATKTNGKNYAHGVNAKARDRLAKFKINTRIKDMLEATGRVVWGNLPIGLRSKMMERVLYYRGQGMWYWDDTLQKFFFLPYSLTAEDEEQIDFYGQYQTVKPYTFNGKAEAKKGAGGKLTRSEVYLGTIVRTPVYDKEDLEAWIAEKGKEWCQKNLCVIIRDYTQQLSEYCIPRSVAQEPIIDFQTEVIPMLRTLMLKTAMPKLVRSDDQGTIDSLLFELQAIEDSIIEGKTMIPVTAFQDLQEIGDVTASVAGIEAFLKVYQSIDNIRKDNLGVPNDGMFQKEAHMLAEEQATKETSSGVVFQDCLDNRQYGSDMINMLWDLEVYVNESAGISDYHAEKEEEEEASTMEKMDAEDGMEEGLQP